MTISIFNGFSTVIDNRRLSDVLKDIQTGVYQEEIEELRKTKKEKLKKKLNAFTPSGVFDGGRKQEYLKQYNGLIVLDIDKLSEKDFEVVQRLAQVNVLTHGAFVSPSGNGYKILVRTENQDQDKHESTFNRLADYFENYLGIEVDRSGKDVTRLCFVSYDTDLYYNAESELFPEIIEGEDLISICVEVTNRYDKYEAGNRNNYIYRLACNTNRYGVEQADAIGYAVDNYAEFGFGKAEIGKAIKSAYEANKDEFADFADFAASAIPDSDTPTFPESVFDNLPDILKESIEQGSAIGKRERDVQFLGNMVVISGIFPNVEVDYPPGKYSSSLFVFIVAPPASGKGILMKSKLLGKQLHDQMKDDIEKPKVFFIPGDVSSARLIEHLDENNGIGVIVEAEADALVKSLKQDYGGHSYIFRNAFQHEAVSSSRKGESKASFDDKYKEIERPKLAIAISGTPSQVKGLIAAVWDGLLSRFVFYKFDGADEWVSPFSINPISDNSLLKQGDRVMQIKKFLDGDVRFELTRDQELRHEKVMRKLTAKSLDKSENRRETVRRLGLILLRFAMVFTILRVKKADNRLVCSDLDFDRAVSIVQTLYSHALEVKELVENNTIRKGLGYRTSFYDSLPEGVFYRKDVIAFATSERVADEYLSYLVEHGYLEKVGFGSYSKISKGSKPRKVSKIGK